MYLLKLPTARKQINWLLTQGSRSGSQSNQYTYNRWQGVGQPGYKSSTQLTDDKVKPTTLPWHPKNSRDYTLAQ